MASLAAGLQELELPFRATLELRYRRGLPDDTIAAVAGFDERVIQRQRQRALAWLAQRTALRGPDAIETVEQNLRALSPAAWAGEPGPAGMEPEEPEAAEEAHEPEPEPEATTPDQPSTAVDETPAEPEVEAPRASMPPPSMPPPLPLEEEPPQEEPEPHRELPSPAPFPAPASKSRGFRTEVSPRTAIGLLVLLVAIIALVFILFSGDSADESGGAPPPVTPAKDSGSKPAKDEKKSDESSGGGAVTMEPVPGADLGGGSIEVSLSGSSAQPDIEIKLKGLPDPEGEYRGWLYDSVIDSRTLGRARSGDGVIAATLPENWQDYPFLDLSVQEPDSIVHSGESIARIPLSDLASP